jgi:hypothetical protein
LLGWLFGSVMLIIAMMIAAVGVVALYRLLSRVLSRSEGPRNQPDQQDDDSTPNGRS